LSDFIRNGASVLPPVKSDVRVPTGTAGEWAADDCNQLRQAALDLRGGLITEVGSRLASEAAIVASGVTPANVTLAPVLATGSTTYRAIGDRFGERVNVKDFGAVGDGITDDSSAIQAAIDYVAARTIVDTIDYAQGGGGVVFLPRGVYLMNNWLGWTADGITLEGEGENATAFKVDMGNNVPDFIYVGIDDGTGRRVHFKDFSIYTDTTYGVNKCRDFIRLGGCTWPRITNVNMRNAGRYGLRIKGTMHGMFYKVRISYCGDSGVFIEDSLGVPQTTADFYHLYTGYNYNHGMLLQASNTVHLYSPVIEYNGASGAATGDGIRLGKNTNEDTAVSLWGGYFESNAGWDINAGVGVSSAQALVQMFGGYATAVGATPKTAGYGFFYGNRAAGDFVGVHLADYTSGNNYITYSLDSTCKVNIAGVPGGGLQTANSANAPVIRDLGGLLDDYEGTVEWYDEQGVRAIRGRYGLRIGNQGTGLAAMKLQRGGAKPTTGTWTVGDLIVNFAPAGNTGREPFAWRCHTAGSPGIWEPMFCSLEPDNGYIAVVAQVGDNYVDGSYRTYGVQFNDDTVAAILPPNDGDGQFRKGRVFTLVVRNNSGGAITNGTLGGAWKWAANTGPGWPDNQKANILTFYCDEAPGSAFEISRSVNVPF